jgi:hypothetical protein
MDHLAFSWKSTQVNLNFEFQVNICIALFKIPTMEKNTFHFNLTSHKTQKFDKPSIQEQEIVPHEPFTTLVDLHRILLPIANIIIIYHLLYYIYYIYIIS